MSEFSAFHEKWRSRPVVQEREHSILRSSKTPTSPTSPTLAFEINALLYVGDFAPPTHPTQLPFVAVLKAHPIHSLIVLLLFRGRLPICERGIAPLVAGELDLPRRPSLQERRKRPAASIRRNARVAASTLHQLPREHLIGLVFELGGNLASLPEKILGPCTAWVLRVGPLKRPCLKQLEPPVVFWRKAAQLLLSQSLGSDDVARMPVV